MSHISHAKNLDSDDFFRRRLALLAIVALVLRVLNIRAIVKSVGQAQILDAAFYHDVALIFSRGRSLAILGDDLSFANSGYPQILGWIYAVCPTPAAALCLQAMLGAVSVWLTGTTTRHLFCRTNVGLWAAALLAFYAPAIFYDGLLLTPSLSLFLTVVLAWAFERALRRNSWRAAAIAGFAIGSSALLRASQLLLLPLMLIVLFRLGHRMAPAAHWRRQAAALALATGLCIVPTFARQRVASRAWVPITTNGGMNFWVGNGQGACGTYREAPFLGSSRGGDYRHTLLIERDRFLTEARRRTANPTLRQAEASGFWFSRALHDIRAAPLAWLSLLGKKAYLTLNNYETRTNASLDLHQELSPVLKYNPMRFGVLFAFAVFGLTLLGQLKHSHARWLLAGLAGAPLITCIVFFVSAEYRHPACVPLIILSAFAISRLQTAVTRREHFGAQSTWIRSLFIVPAAMLSMLPVQPLGPARDRKAYAEALAMPNTDGSLPTLERYALARRLLEGHGDSAVDRIYSTEALLLVDSNQAIQFRDRVAAARLIDTARGLWHEELHPSASLNSAEIDRIRTNLERRVAQLGRQSFVTQWTDIAARLALLGSHHWREAPLLLDRGLVQQAESFLSRSYEMAPRSVRVLAYRGELEWLQNRDGGTWIEQSLAEYPKLALPAVLAKRHALALGDVPTARRYADMALSRESAERSTQQQIGEPKSQGPDLQ